MVNEDDLINFLGRRTEILEMNGWGERTPSSRIVAIGHVLRLCRDVNRVVDNEEPWRPPG
jgi:hypothetical protein